MNYIHTENQIGNHNTDRVWQKISERTTGFPHKQCDYLVTYTNKDKDEIFTPFPAFTNAQHTSVPQGS
jgi:hypothetical protein